MKRLHVLLTFSLKAADVQLRLPSLPFPEPHRPFFVRYFFFEVFFLFFIFQVISAVPVWKLPHKTNKQILRQMSIKSLTETEQTVRLQSLEAPRDICLFP